MPQKKILYEQFIADMSDLNIGQTEAKKLFDTSWKIEKEYVENNFDEWIEKIKYGIILLDEGDYVKALIHALRIAPKLASSDYGTSRQRDLGQLWTDTTRGFLGEIALSKFVKSKFGIKFLLDYTLGDVEDYLPSDIKKVELGDGSLHEPKIRVSFKSTKFNGIWLDEPGEQITRSDSFILIKLGIGRDHFVGFWKWISAIGDKLIPFAQEMGAINDEIGSKIMRTLPDFAPIPSYIAGFIDQSIVTCLPEPNYKYKARYFKNGDFKHYELLNYIGWVEDGNKPLDIPEEVKNKNFQFASIGNFSRQKHFIASTTFLKTDQADWQSLINRIVGA